MKVVMYAGYGSLREQRWSGKLDVLPQEGNAIVIPKTSEGYCVERVVFRLDLKPPVVEITIR